MNWEDILPESVHKLREVFDNFLENGGTPEDCVEVLNEFLEPIGIVSRVSTNKNKNKNNTRNRLALPNNNTLRKIYEERNRSVPKAPEVYTTPQRPPPPIPRSFSTPHQQTTPFAPPRQNTTRKRPRPRIFNMLNEENNNRSRQSQRKRRNNRLY
jgi:hypothetical protein